MNPFTVVRDFEQALCDYTGAKYAVTTTSCTTALLLALAYHFREVPLRHRPWIGRPLVEIPKHTYVGVAMSILHAGARVAFREEHWRGTYQLKPLDLWDSARRFHFGMYGGGMECVSFHWNKILGIQQGGAILHSDPEADHWLRRARFDGRTEGMPPAQERFDQLGWHAYMAPETAAAGLVRLAALPTVNDDLPWDDYPDLSQMEIFR